jgi:transcriptional regulator with XRE-family HTH domain
MSLDFNPNAGSQIKRFRQARGLSQLALALEANISTRHLSCVETNKASPSRTVLARLSEALQLSLVERNALWLAAGFAAQHPETPLPQPALAPVRHAIDCMLAQQEPYPAFLLDRHWQILQSDRAADRINRFLLDGRDSAHSNILLQFFDPTDLRGVIENWPEVAIQLFAHVRLAVARFPQDQRMQAILQQLMAFPNVPKKWRDVEIKSTQSPILRGVLKRPA